VIAKAAHSAPAPFYGGGRRIATSIALNAEHLALLAELSKATGLALNAIAVAAIQSGLPVSSEAAREAIVAERVARAGAREPRREGQLRLPEQLRARTDELTAGARETLPRIERADLINAALERGLPSDAQSASELVATHAQRLELSQAA
jgi:hypothetical protein